MYVCAYLCIHICLYLCVHVCLFLHQCLCADCILNQSTFYPVCQVTDAIRQSVGHKRRWQFFTYKQINVHTKYVHTYVRDKQPKSQLAGRVLHARNYLHFVFFFSLTHEGPIAVPATSLCNFFARSYLPHSTCHFFFGWSIYKRIDCLLLTYPITPSLYYFCCFQRVQFLPKQR